MREPDTENSDAPDLPPSHENPWRELPALCDNLVADGVVNHAEAAILRNWLSADRWSAGNKKLARIDCLVSKLLSEKRISDDERREILDYLKRLF